MKLTLSSSILSGLAFAVAAKAASNSTANSNSTIGNSTSDCVHPISSDSLDGASAWGIWGAVPAFDDKDIIPRGGDYAFYNWAYAAFSDGYWNASLVAPPGVPLPNSTSRWNFCDMTISNMPVNTVERGQNDNGSCVSTFDRNCRDSLSASVLNAFTSYSQAAHSAGTGFSEDDACQSMKQAVINQANNATTCAKYLKGYAISGSLLNPPDENGTCQATSNKIVPGSTFHIAQTSTKGQFALDQAGIFAGPLSGPGSEQAAYNQSYRNVVAKISYLIPKGGHYNAGESVSSLMGTPWINCLRVNMTADGAVVPSQLPAASHASLLAPRAAVILSSIVVTTLSVLAFGGASFL